MKLKRRIILVVIVLVLFLLTVFIVDTFGLVKEREYRGTLVEYQKVNLVEDDV